MKNSNLKFKHVENYFMCPICKNEMHIENNTLKCQNNHCFDIAKKGYINFLSNRKPQKGYDKSFFENRNIILNQGYYDHICDYIQSYINTFKPDTVIDAGCGEGFYVKKLYNENIDFFAFDLSKDAINVAARGMNNICFFVSDIQSIPLKDNSIDCMLNIYTPANYPEFKRVLKKDGIIIKIIPGLSHLKELRHIVKDSLKHEQYDNKEVIDCFKEHCTLLDMKELNQTKTISIDNLKSFLDMTPLLFDIDKSKFDYNNVNEITISATALIGKIR
ncbi:MULTISPECIES: putative RNA methyltransferase [Anaerofustis]|uniref:putative RNA methyltransferase n=1 Tax=Anaerofustis TaxID=264995 RepID=UPI0011061553|nr:MULTISPECIES: methyltransferase domain-containing protein [Anaerofustis]MCO8194792.1 methyltransferase domain-containing protein [Anaerofustis sp. NSJ-163]